MMDKHSNVKPAQARLDLAADFAVRMYSGKMSPQEQSAMEQWLRDTPENRTELQAILDTWHSVGALAGRRQEMGAVSSCRNRTGKRWFSYAVAASVLVAITSFVTIRWREGDTPAQREVLSYQTAIGEQKTVVLDDGSQVTLNTNSRLIVDFDDVRRRVTLDRGEAFFDVTPLPQKPFIVLTGTHSVTVLGTSFNVLKSAFDLEVAVVDGAVMVHAVEESVTPRTPAVDLLVGVENAQTADRYRLSAGVFARFSGTLGGAKASVTVGEVTRGSYLGWKQGFVTFDKQPLYEVIKELNRYVGKKILIEDDRIMNMAVSGVFNVHEIDAALNRIESAFPIRVVEHTDRVVIVGRIRDEG